MLQKGDKAPYFEGPDQDGNIIRLSDFAGRRLVLYFYPKDSTPGCTAEACDLRDNYQRFPRTALPAVRPRPATSGTTISGFSTSAMP